MRSHSQLFVYINNYSGFGFELENNNIIYESMRVMVKSAQNNQYFAAKYTLQDSSHSLKFL
jgi:hypothetical protein